jgi:hypothetical protein
MSLGLTARVCERAGRVRRDEPGRPPGYPTDAIEGEI